MKRCRDYEIRVCGKDSIPQKKKERVERSQCNKTRIFCTQVFKIMNWIILPSRGLNGFITMPSAGVYIFIFIIIIFICSGEKFKARHKDYFFISSANKTFKY